MIQANELRIGNLVTDEWGISNFIVDSINQKGIDLEIKDDGNWSEIAQNCIEPNYKIEDLRGIPLNEEILLSLGFSTTISNRDSGYKQLGKVLYGIDFMFCVECNCEPDFFIDNKYIKIKIKHVHQLQNLIFALTGSELVLSNVPEARKPAL